MPAPLHGRKVLFVIAPEQFRDEELFEPKKALEAAGARTSIASTKTAIAIGMLGGKVMPQMSLRDAHAADFDAVVVVGGAGAPRHLWDQAQLHGILRDAAKAGKVVAGICLSGAVLAKAGVLQGKRATCWPDPAALGALEKGGATYEKTGVVADGKCVTADGPTSAKAFGEAVAKAMQG